MNKIYYPKWLSIEYYDATIENNENVILDGFYYGPHNKAFKKSRVELGSSYKLIYTCDYWLDGYCWQDNHSFYKVPDTTGLRLIEKYYDITIPLGCLIIAVTHRGEKHIMGPDGNGFDIIFKKEALFDYLELNK